jgi:hypothetical protein
LILTSLKGRGDTLWELEKKVALGIEKKRVKTN